MALLPRQSAESLLNSINADKMKANLVVLNGSLVCTC